MKRPALFLLLFFFPFLLPVLAEEPSAGMNRFFYSGPGTWAEMWTGRSQVFMGDLQKVVGSWGKVYGAWPHPTYTDAEGFDLGLEFGLLLDAHSGLSISASYLEAGHASFEVDFPGSGYYEQVVSPRLFSFLANYCFFLEKEPGRQTLLSGGAGWCYGGAYFNANQYVNGNLTAWGWGYYYGGAPGADLRVQEKLSLGSGFGICLEAVGRWAVIEKAVCDFTDNNYDPPRTYPAVLGVNGSGLIESIPESALGNVSGARPLVLDFSGFDLNLGLFYHF